MSDPASLSSSSKQRSSTEEDVSPLSSHELDSPFEVPALPVGVGLKPCLDSIFADVQANLPSIDFDLSDVSSDEELQILTRSASKGKSTKSRRKNLTPELWKNTVSSEDPVDILEEPGYEFQDPFSLSDKSTDGKDSGVSVSSSNGRYQRELLSSGTASHRDEDEPSSGGEAGQTTQRMLSSSDSFSSQSDDDTLEVIEEIIGFKNIPIELNFGEDSAVVSQVESESRRSETNGRRSTLTRRVNDGQTSARRLKFDTYMPLGAPVLETGPIDHIDLDLLLDAFPERQVPPSRGRDLYPLPSHGAGDVEQTQDFKSLQLMNQLAHLCVEQSGGTVRSEDLTEPVCPAPLHPKPSAGRRAVKLAWQESRTNSEAQTVEPADLSLNLSSLQEDVGSPPKEESLSSRQKTEAGKKRETIFLDLRKKDEDVQQTLETEHPEAVRRILRLHSPSESVSSSDEESDDEDPLVAWHQERRKALARAQEVKGQECPTVVRKDLSGTDRDKLPHPPRVIPLADETTSKSHPGSAKVEERVPPTPPQSPAAATPPRKDSRAAQELEKRQKTEILKRLREQREAERQSRCRLQSQLNAMKPTASSSKRHPAAQNTPVVFDMDSSYGVTPDPLPSFLRPEDEIALLTAHLSKLGELSTPRSSEGPMSNSGTYSVFLSLMLSLVPTSFDFFNDKVMEKRSEGQYLDSIPFRVIGLQQVFQEGELLINIAVVPKIPETSQFFKTRSKRLKNEKRSTTTFQYILTKFFASSTLQSLCPWLEDLSYFAISDKGDLVSSPPGARYESCLEDGTYLPPVPHVTTRPLSTFLSVNPDPMAASRVFSIPVSFFWQTIDTEEHLQPHIPKNVEQDIVDIQNTMSLIYKSLFTKSLSMMGVLHRIFQENLEVVGLRLLYINDSILNNPSAIHPQGRSSAEDEMVQGPVLALALRGSDARSVWLDAVGPSDPVLAQRTDPKSIMANYGGQSRDELVMYCPRNPNRINYDLSFWFGGRVPPGGVVDLKSLENSSSSRVSEGGKKKKGKKGAKRDSQLDESSEEFPMIRMHISTLVASTLGDIFLTIAPLVPPVCLGMIASVCHKRGFLICGVKRMRLNSKRAASLGLTGAQVKIFSPVSCTTPTSPKNYEDELKSSIESGFPTTTSSPMPSTILLLRKENALHHSSSLQETLMVTLSVKGILAAIKANCGAHLTSSLCFHVTPYSDNLLATLGGDFNKVPSYERFSSSSVPPSFYSNPELEQIVVTAFTGAETLRNVGDSLGILLGMSLHKEDHFTSLRERGLELLGLKFIPSLTMAQAKELTPFEVGTSNWQESIQFFSSQPSLICIMRGVDAFQRVHLTLKTPITPRSRRQLPQDALKVVMSLSPEIAYRQAAHFFRDHELFADPTMRENLKFFPPLRSPSLEELSTARFSWAEEPPLSPGGKRKVKGGGQKSSKGMLIVEESIFKTMLTGPRLLTTLLLIKPFAVNKYLSKILKRVLQEDFTIVAMKMLLLTPDQASVLVPSATRSDRIISSMHVEHLMSGPCLALCVLRENAVKKLLDILGPANPREAKQKNQFLWRGLYGADPVNNALHGSESYANAVQEIKLLFPDGVSCTETPDLRADGITSPGVDGVLGSVEAKKRQFKLKKFDPSTSNSSASVSSSTSSTSLESTSGQRSCTGVSVSPSEISLPSHSALCQTNCLLLTPILQLLDVGSHRKGYVEVVDSLLTHGFEVVAMRMFWLTTNQADDFLTLHDRPSPDVSKMLSRGPCIAIAVQRDNAVNCFETSLGSNLEKDSIISKYGSSILRPKNTEAASRYLEFFFDELMPQSQGYISQVVACDTM